MSSESQETVAALGNRIKSLFESKQWSALGQCLPFPTLWFVYQPLSIPEAQAMADKVLRDAQDIEVSLLRILRTESSDTTSRGSYLCRLGWFEPGALKQHEVSFDLHLGFRTKPDVRLEYFGITQASPEPSLPVEEPAAEQPAPRAADASAAAVQLPLGVLAGSPVTSGAADAPVMVYVPVLVPASVAQGLVRGARGG